jgi:protein-S-isoprenylcysteine O-methyltransferase Ste14
MSPASAAALELLGVVAYGALHSWLASLQAKRLARQLLGPSVDRFYRLGFNLVGAITLLPLLALAAWQPGWRMYAVPPPLLWLFLAGQVVALAVIGLGLLQTDAWHFLGLRQLTQVSDPAPPPLVTTGFYRYVRHPLYTAGFVFLWLTPVMTSTLLVLYAGLSLYLYVGSLFEERRLIVEFGPSYREYQRRVPRLIPRLRQRPPG